MQSNIKEPRQPVILLANSVEDYKVAAFELSPIPGWAFWRYSQLQVIHAPISNPKKITGSLLDFCVIVSLVCHKSLLWVEWTSVL